MREIVETRQVRESISVVNAVIEARDTGAVGQIIGDPGTGKTVISHYLTEKFEHVRPFRVCVSQGVNNKLLISRIYQGLGVEIGPGSAATLLARVEHLVEGRLMVIDEGNHLTWRQLELLRFLADERGMALILIGTDLLDRPFRDGRTATLLAQLSSRIGGKRVHLEPFKKVEEVTGYMLTPQFGPVNKTTAQRFHKHCSGFWRDGQELMNACHRVMKLQGIEELSPGIIDAAAESMKPRRAA